MKFSNPSLTNWKIFHPRTSPISASCARSENPENYNRKWLSLPAPSSSSSIETEFVTVCWKQTSECAFWNFAQLASRFNISSRKNFDSLLIYFLHHFNSDVDLGLSQHLSKNFKSRLNNMISTGCNKLNLDNNDDDVGGDGDNDCE